MNSSEPPRHGPDARRRLVWSLVGSATADPGIQGSAASLQRLCRAVVARLLIRGAAVHLMTMAGSAGVAAFSDDTTGTLAELQFAVNEGPSYVAFRTRRPVLVPALEESLDRWPGYSTMAMDHGVRAVFAFPMQEGAVSFGVLELYADRAGPLDAEGMAMAAAFAQAATELLLDDGVITAGGEFHDGLTASSAMRARIHQAQGMVMVDLGVTLAEALTRMRARAFAHDLSLLELADGVISGTLAAAWWMDGNADGVPEQ